MKRWILLLAAVALVSAACSSSGGTGVASITESGDVVSSEDPADESTQIDDSAQTDEEALIAFAACMRDNGVPEFEDPTLNADGSVDFSFRSGGQVEGEPFGGVDRDVVRAAFDTCAANLEGLALGPGGGGFDTAEFEDQFVAFAACMRDNGVQMDDPDFSSFGPGQGGERGNGPFGSLDFDDPAVQAALEECQELFTDFAPRIGGGGRGGAQG